MPKVWKSIMEWVEDFWYNWYSRIIPTIVAMVCGYAIYNRKIYFTTSAQFDDLLTAVLTGSTILTGFMAGLIGLVVQSRESSAVKLFFEISQEKGERRLIGTLKSSILSGFIVLFLSGILFVRDKLPCGEQKLFLIWIWFVVYFGTSTYRLIALFVTMLFMQVKPTQKQSVNQMSEADSQELKNQLPRSKK